MLKNYLKIAVRNIFKEGTYSVIKISGLVIGLAAIVIISLFLFEDLSFDMFHSKKDRIVRVLTIDSAQGVQSQVVGVSQAALGPAAVEEIPEVENYVRILGGSQWRLQIDDKEFQSENGIMTENSFFQVFDFEIIDGQRDSALSEPNSVVLTESLAKKIFGEEDPIGNVLRLDGTTELNIKAVMKDPPANSHIQFDIIRSLVAPEDQPGWQQFLTNWSGINCYNYLLLDKPHNDLNPIIEKLIDLKARNEAAEFFTPTLQPLKDVHLHSKNILFESNHAKTDVSNVFIMISIGSIILILASVNFMNLVTAKSSTRAMEIGVRKVMGGVKQQLIFQHLSESVLIVIVSFVIALGLVYFILPVLNSTYHRSADFAWLLTPQVGIGIVSLTLLLGLLAGSYPAFVLSAFKPVDVLKGGFKGVKSGSFVRKGLVVFQFVISISLIATAGVIYRQMDYIHTMDMGYSRDQVVTIQMSTQEMIQRLPVFREKLLAIPGVSGVGTSSVQIGQQLGRNSITPEGTSEDDNYITSVMQADETYIEVMEMQIVDGRNFEKDSQVDSASSLLINEELAAMLQWADPVGKTISLDIGPDGDPTPFNVIGVVKNFNFATIQHPIEPVYLRYGRNNSVVSIRLEGSDISSTVSEIEKQWTSSFPGNLFEYSFMDEDFEVLYENETAFAAMFNHLTFLAIFIAVMGLFGLSAYAAEQRTKEIGIRKVLGAKVIQIVLMLSMEFIILVALAFVLSVPLAWYGAGMWLESFVYRIDMEWDLFILSALIAIVVAIFTVSWQSFRVAISNPIQALRDE